MKAYGKPRKACANRKIKVFPTPVGVFLSFHGSEIKWARLPHTRGGVSCKTGFQGSDCLSSPHPWGVLNAEAQNKLR